MAVRGRDDLRVGEIITAVRSDQSRVETQVYKHLRRLLLGVTSGYISAYVAPAAELALGLGFSIAGALVCFSTYDAIIAPGKTTGDSATSTAAKAMNNGHASNSAADA